MPTAVRDVIALEGVSKRYGERVGVADLSLHVPEGSVFGFIGPNGAGKPTAVKVLPTFTTPTAGKAFVQGIDVGVRLDLTAEMLDLPGQLLLAPDRLLQLERPVRAIDVEPVDRRVREQLRRGELPHDVAALPLPEAARRIAQDEPTTLGARDRRLRARVYVVGGAHLSDL